MTPNLTHRKIEIWFDGHEAAVHGMILQESGTTLKIRLYDEYVRHVPKHPGASALVVISAADSQRMSLARVQADFNDILYLTLCDPAQLYRRDCGPLYSCQISARCRSFHANGCVAPWNEALITEIGIGGINIVVPLTRSIPKRLEIKFRLASGGRRGVARVYTDSGLEFVNAVDEGLSVRVIAQTVGLIPRPEGGDMGVALEIVNITQSDRRLLAEFIESSDTA